MNLLVVRFSALGDVAMTVPVIDALARACPQHRITVLSRPFMEPLFAGMPPNVRFLGADLKGAYRGVWGLLRLYHRLSAEHFDAVADLHDVLRTKLLRLLFRAKGVRTVHIDKGRREKRALTNVHHRRGLFRLHTSFVRYMNVFSRLGLPPITATFHSIYGASKGDVALFREVAGEPDGRRWIGIAPFAAHAGKVLPADTTEQLIRLLAARKECLIFLFGGGGNERVQMERWSRDYDNVRSLSGKLKLHQELALMSHLDVMVSMDSANMHLASLVALPVVSVWGATHPYAGFMGWRQHERLAVQHPMACRPCSIYGNRPCVRGDYACLRSIKAEEIVAKVDEVLTKK